MTCDTVLGNSFIKHITAEQNDSSYEKNTSSKQGVPRLFCFLCAAPTLQHNSRLHLQG